MRPSGWMALAVLATPASGQALPRDSTAGIRRVPTEEFLARVADTEATLKAAEAELNALEHSLY